MTTKRADGPTAPANPLATNPFNPPGNQGPNNPLQPAAPPANPLQLGQNQPPPAPAPTPAPTPTATPQPGGGGGVAPPIHGQDGIIVPPPNGVNPGPGQGANIALDQFAPPAPPPPDPGANLPPASFSGDPFVPLHSQHTRPTPPPARGMPGPSLGGDTGQSPMGVGGGAGPEMQQSPGNKPPSGLAPYAQRAAERVAQLPPEARQQAMQGAAESISGIIEQRGPAAQQQLEAIMRNGQAPIQMRTENAQRLQSQGFDPQAAMQTIQNMGPMEHFLLWGGLGLGAIGLIQALSGEGGLGSFVMAALGLGAAGGTAANAGLLGQGAQGMVQGLLGTGQQPPPGNGGARPSAAGNAPPPTPGGAPPAAAQGRAQMLSQTAMSRPEMLPDLFGQFAHELRPEQRSRLDQAASLWRRTQEGNQLLRQGAQAVYDSLGVNNEIAALGISPQAIPPLLNAWSQWSPRNPARPQPPTGRPPA